MKKFINSLPKEILAELLITLYARLPLVKYNLDEFKKRIENEKKL